MLNDTPDNPPFDLPSWQFVTQTGNTNGGGGNCPDGYNAGTVEKEIRDYNGQIVYIPQFDVTCAGKNNDPDPDQSQVSNSPNYGCPPAQLNAASGSNLWYRMPSLAYFELCSPSTPECNGAEGAYIQGTTELSASPAATVQRHASSASSSTSWAAAQSGPASVVVPARPRRSECN